MYSETLYEKDPASASAATKPSKGDGDTYMVADAPDMEIAWALASWVAQYQKLPPSPKVRFISESHPQINLQTSCSGEKQPPLLA